MAFLAFVWDSSYVVLLPCRTWIVIGVNRSMTSIQTSCQRKIKSAVGDRKKYIILKTHFQKFMNLALNGISTTFQCTAVPEACVNCVARQTLSNLIACRTTFKTLIQTACFCRAFVELYNNSRSTTYELGHNFQRKILREVLRSSKLGPLLFCNCIYRSA